MMSRTVSRHLGKRCFVRCKNANHLKGKVYKTIIGPVLVHRAEAWTVTGREKWLLKRTEMRMLRWILGVSLQDKKDAGVACINDKIRLRWYGHVMRREDENPMKRSRGQPAPQLRTTSEAMRRHHTARHEVSPT